MNMHQLMAKYSFYGSIVTSWSWAESHRLILEVDLANFNQVGYSEKKYSQDFRSIILIFDCCTIIDELDEGFNGFSKGDARILEASQTRKEDMAHTKLGIKLAMMHDIYDGSGEKFISVIIFADDVAIIDPNDKFG
jgi:hypothetical protein